MLKGKKIGFIGGGFMAESLIKGLVTSGSSDSDDISVTDIRKERLDHLEAAYKVRRRADNVELAGSLDILVLAVKPDDIPAVLDEVAGSVSKNLLLISIAAGVKISSIAKSFSGKIVRAMPNTCAEVGEAVTAISFNPAVGEDDAKLVDSFFSSVGRTITLRESLMDAVTAVSGSGPAYIYVVIESMIQAGVEGGLSFEDSRMLVLQTVKGSAELAIQTGEHPASLRERVTSPKGTTLAALHVLEKNNVRGAFLDAVEAALKRSKELG